MSQYPSLSLSSWVSRVSKSPHNSYGPVVHSMSVIWPLLSNSTHLEGLRPGWGQDSPPAAILNKRRHAGHQDTTAGKPDDSPKWPVSSGIQRIKIWGSTPRAADLCRSLRQHASRCWPLSRKGGGTVATARSARRTGAARKSTLQRTKEADQGSCRKLPSASISSRKLARLLLLQPGTLRET